VQELLYIETDDLIFASFIVSYAAQALKCMQILRRLYSAELDPWLGIRAIERLAWLRIFWAKQRAKVVLDLD